MAAASLTLAFLMLAAGATPPDANDVVPMNSRHFQIPIQIEGSRAKIKELILFSSADQGKTWQQSAVAAPDKDAFIFYAPTDGLYWFNIMVVDSKGNREPPDIYKSKPRQKVLVDTLKPTLRILSAERQGDDVVVNWEIQEDHPDLTTLKLEYRTPDAPTFMPYLADITQAMKGQGRFRFNSPSSVVVRMQVMDEAGNLGSDEKVVAAKPVASNPVPPTIVPVSGQSNGPAIPPPSFPATSGTSTSRSGAETTPGSPAPLIAAPPTQPLLNSTNPPSAPASPVLERPSGVQPAGLRQNDVSYPAERNWGSQTTSNYNQSSSRATDLGSRALSNPNNHWSALPLPLQFTNNRQISLDYEITKVGPSGVGSVELYVTQDDGQTWQRFAESQSPDLRPPLTVMLPGDGIYGMRLVVGSRAGLGRRPPKPGDLPQMRVKVDTTPPEAKLDPPQADPSRRDALLLTWKATDENLPSNPITLLWSETPNGNWQTIAADVTNSGRFSWILPKSPMPPRVYLRLMVRDQAGNVAYDETPEPVSIDLLEPEGHLKGLIIASPRP
jgi:hypothetical protein